MPKGTSNRCTDRLVAAALLALVLIATVSLPVGAVDVAEEDVPAEAAVESKTEATVRLTDLYRDPNLESWTLAGSTDLTAVTWTVTFYDQGGNQIAQESHDGTTFSQPGIALDDGVSEVAVKVTGTVPPVGTYTYDPPQTYKLLSLTQTREGGTSTPLGTWESHHYTAESREARTAIDAAATAIADARTAGADPRFAEQSLQDAIEAYEGENFGLATSLASRAEERATNAQQASETNRLLLYGGAVVVAVALLGALVYWYRTRQEPYDRLG